MNGRANQGWRMVAILHFALILLTPVVGDAQEDRVSRFGQYEGYSEPVYDNWMRTSQYVTARDGTKLAVDIFRPVDSGGVPVEDPLPVIWTHDRYQRAFILPNGDVFTQLRAEPWLETMLRHGYVVGVVDVRGGGASYGTRTGPFSPEETQDAYDITEWFAAQPWSNGRIGMYGRSYLGITQYMAASTAPPHLVAIFPEMAMFDFYSFVYPGGVFRHDFVSEWSSGVRRRDTDPIYPSPPVDEDRNGVMLREATAEHWANTDVYALGASATYRDSPDANDVMIHVERSPSTYVEEVKQSGVAIYHLVGWYDMYPRDALLWFNNLEPNSPQKLVIGPWNHSASAGLDWAAEHLRWYDFWLKDVDNAVMDEPPIHYYTMGAPPEQALRTAWQWPLPEEQPTHYYFRSGPSGSVESANDGLLSPTAPTSPNGQDDVSVDYSTTTGRATRWTNGYGGDFEYPDMTTNDEKGLTYTTSPLDADIELTGHPVVHLWVSSTAADGNFFVYLEEVEELGGRRPTFRSHYITEGSLRASHRANTLKPLSPRHLYPTCHSFKEHSRGSQPLPGGPTAA